MKEIDIGTVEADAFQKIEQRLCHIPGAVNFAARNTIRDVQRHVRAEVYKKIPEVFGIKEKELRSRKVRQGFRSLNIRYNPGVGVIGDTLIFGSKLPLGSFEGNTSYDIRSPRWRRVPDVWTGEKPLWRAVFPSVPAKAHLMLGKAALELVKSGHHGAFYAKVKASGGAAAHEGIFERVGDPRDRKNYSDPNSEKNRELFGGINMRLAKGKQKISELKGLSLPHMAGNEKVYRLLGDSWEKKIDERAEHYIEYVLANGVPTRRGGR